jgi:hypothetical protein
MTHSDLTRRRPLKTSSCLDLIRNRYVHLQDSMDQETLKFHHFKFRCLHTRDLILRDSPNIVLCVQDYIDSMEGATLSGRRTAAYICGAGEELLALRKKLVIDDSEKALGNVQVLQTS